MVGLPKGLWLEGAPLGTLLKYELESRMTCLTSGKVRYATSRPEALLGLNIDLSRATNSAEIAEGRLKRKREEGSGEGTADSPATVGDGAEEVAVRARRLRE